ncbi:ABC transporter substrate-binding protein [Paenibacillus lupini]|uniref:ABC transporter substrate-binding protein n=1 Tax=Paenibacillus lupini TaxID=1450204 RepID=UPI00142399EA|nr:ABC transporter substrate-binding protein [Paenibacillus lupini]NIK23045.1 sn-glycerol 3-phosphate transport system substrate-binding protein [Paenibacillus lupini]
MKAINWKMALPVLALANVLVIQGCGTSNSANTPNSAASSNAADTSNEAPVTINWWHAMSGTNGKVLDQIVKDFNASQSHVVVKATFQGAYDELLNKVKATMGSKSGPALVQMNDVNTRFMIDSQAITPVQTLIDRDKYDISELEPNILNYYTVNNQLYSMPFNTSNDIFYYNKDLFKAAGLDPEKPPATFEEVEAAAKALTKDGVTGYAFYIEPWDMEQSFAKQGELYVNNDNGRSGEAATESLMNSEAGVKTLSFWKDMIDNKNAQFFGRVSADAQKAFTAGKVAMLTGSTGALRGMVEGAKGKFEVGTGFFPIPAGSSKEGGVAIGGGSNWIMNDKSQEEQDAAWEFIKYLSSAKVQALWHVSTGYFPTTTAAYDEQIVKDNLVKYPQFNAAVEQLHQSKSNYASQGASLGVFQEMRNFYSTAVEEAINGASPQEALDKAAKSSTEAIQKYNDTNK